MPTECSARASTPGSAPKPTAATKMMPRFSEITSALDASVQAQVLEHLAAMQRRQGTAMLLITHDLSVVWRMARRVAVMQGGRILETGETEAIFRHPANPYTAALLGAATRAARAGQPELVDATG